MEVDYITAEAIKDLTYKETADPVATLYIPMHQSASPPHMTEDQIRCKNLFHKAIAQLELNQELHHQKLAKALRAQLEELLADKTFWERQTQGLLVCAGNDSTYMFHLPIDTEEYVAIDNFYHLAPVLGLLEDSQAFYVLLVAQQAPALYRGDMYDLHLTDVKLPLSLMKGLNIDENNQKSEQQRSASGSSVRTNSENGRGGAKNPLEDDRLRYFRMIDKIIMNHADRSLPLILAGIESEVVEYRSISKYPHLVDKSLHGNFGNIKPHELFNRARALLKDTLVEAHHQEMFSRFERLKGENPELTAFDDITTSEAADEGRIDTLFIDMSRFTTDTVRDNNQPATVLSFPKGEPAKLLQTVARHVWLQGGRIINMVSDKFPLNTHMAAICRY